MQISSRFTIAVHILAYTVYFGKEESVTSDTLSKSIQVNPVIIRRIMSQLKKAGLIDTDRGHGGTTRLTRDPSDISFYDVYKAVDLLQDDSLFHFHENPNPSCPVGRNIHHALDSKLDGIQKAMEDQMKQDTIADVVKDIRRQNRKRK
jgi:Rrf2 family protein